MEVAITSDINNSQWNCSVWNIETGTQLQSYKGGSSGSGTLTFLQNNQFLMTADQTKPILHIWPVNHHDQIGGPVYVMPGRVSSLATTTDGTFCVAGIGETVTVWHVPSGKMVANINQHFQTVNCIKFTDDDTHFVTGGRDGNVFLWKLASCVQFQCTNPKYVHSFIQHALPITNLHIGFGGLTGRLYSVSLDRTCKIFDLITGTLLLNIVFQQPLHSVVVNRFGSTIYVGQGNGEINEFSIKTPPRMREFHVIDDTNRTFTGHNGPVTHLSLSLNGINLMSGSEDSTVIIWHIPTKHIIRTLPHKGPIMNAQFVLLSKLAFEPEPKPKLISNVFKRMPDSSDSEFTVKIMVSKRLNDFIPSENEQQHETEETGQTIHEMEKTIKQLRQANKDLFQFSVNNLINDR